MVAVVDVPSAPAAEAELVWVGWRRGGVVTGEACMAKAVRAIRDGIQHPFEGQVSEGVDAEMLPDPLEVEIGGDQLFPRRGVDAVVAGARDRR